MKLRNLTIMDCEVNDKNLVLDGINELEKVIMDNWEETVKREIAIEFNISSRLGEPKEYLVVYANPDYKRNPYVFILKADEEGRRLVKETTLVSFGSLADFDIRRSVNKTIAIGFKNLPKHAFLSMDQIDEARDYAKEYDIER